MLSIETRVNGVLIGYAHVKNIHQIDSENCLYHVEYHQFGKKSKVINFDIIHNKNSSAEKLSLLIYEKMNEVLK